LVTVDPEEAKLHLKSFLWGCGLKLMPFLAIFEVIAAQEALKLSPILCFPVKQFMFYDCNKVLPKLDQDEARKGTSCLAPGLCYILGDDVVLRWSHRLQAVEEFGFNGCWYQG
jgi:hypothetical protein